MVTMGAKRKRDGDQTFGKNDFVARPATGTKTFHTGKDVKQGLALGTRQGELLIFNSNNGLMLHF